MKKPSILYWIICVVLLLWNCVGAFDYVMTRTQNEAYMGSFPPELLEYFYNMPLLMDITWPLAVWTGVLGWIAMLLRKRWAVPLFLISFISMIINFGISIFDGGLALQAQYLGVVSYIMTALVVGLGIFALWYSHRARANGTLR